MVKNISTHFRRLNHILLPNHLQTALLFLILAACLGARLWIIDTPALDRTAWKEIDYIEISKNYWQHGFHFLYPEITWPAEAPRYTAMELPLVPYVAAILYKAFGFNVFTVRAIPTVGYLVLVVYQFLLIRRLVGPLPAILSATTCAVLPLFHPFRNYLFSEPVILPCIVATIFHFSRWVDYQSKIDYLIATLVFSLAVALKLEPLYLCFPLGYLATKEFGLDFKRYIPLVIFFVLIIQPSLLWYSWAHHLAMTGLDVFGVFGGLGNSGHDKFQTLSMLSNFYWYKTIGERVIEWILGGQYGLFFFIVGFIASIFDRKSLFLFIYLGTVLLYIVLVAEGNFDAPYRQLNLLPLMSFFYAEGVIFITAIILLVIPHRFSFKLHAEYAHPLIVAICFILILAGPAFKAERLFYRDTMTPVSGHRWEVAQMVKPYVLPTDKLIAVGEYSIHKGGNDLSPMLYYYTGLQGWTLQQNDWTLERVQELVMKGATYLVVVRKDPAAESFLTDIKNAYHVIFQDERMMLVDLRNGKH